MRATPSTSFLVPVSCIVCTSAKEQMIWVDTAWNITVMQYAQSNRNWAVRQLPSQSMGCLKPAVFVEVAIAHPTPNASGPEPAVRRPLDLRPEAFLNLCVSRFWMVAHFLTLPAHCGHKLYLAPVLRWNTRMVPNRLCFPHRKQQ